VPGHADGLLMRFISGVKVLKNESAPRLFSLFVA